MEKVIFFEKNPRFPKLHGRGKKPNEFIIMIQHQHGDGKIVDRIIGFANGKNDLKAKIKNFMKEKGAEVDMATEKFLSGKPASKSSNTKSKEAPSSKVEAPKSEAVAQGA